MNKSKPAWVEKAIFYHIYPLGLCGAPAENNYQAVPTHRMTQLREWTGHIRSLGCNALYLGPLFESGTHGYDTTDYFAVDRRLGTNDTLRDLVKDFHSEGITVVLDGVFHHVGRDFWAFQDLLKNGQLSPYRDWFHGVDFNKRSPYGDSFAYDGWNGHFNLVKLNLRHPHVQEHLFAAVKKWIEDFGIDGLRLDAADVMDLQFQQELARYCHQLRPDFWLLGEVIHGDYRRWINEGELNSTTNYECYKGLYSSHNDHNYFEIAHSLNRLFGPEGIYRDLHLYSFVDNHDVNRIASTLQNPAHLYTLYALLFTMPGIPSIYYGSEWGIKGQKQHGSDKPLRPALDLKRAEKEAPHPTLAEAIGHFAHIRHEHAALQTGTYRQRFVGPEQFAFSRITAGDHIVVLVNSADQPAKLSLPVDEPEGSSFTDLLEPKKHFFVKDGHLQIDSVPSCWARVLKLQNR